MYLNSLTLKSFKTLYKDFLSGTDLITFVGKHGIINNFCRKALYKVNELIWFNYLLHGLTAHIPVFHFICYLLWFPHLKPTHLICGRHILDRSQKYAVEFTLHLVTKEGPRPFGYSCPLDCMRDCCLVLFIWYVDIIPNLFIVTCVCLLAWARIRACFPCLLGLIHGWSPP